MVTSNNSGESAGKPELPLRLLNKQEVADILGCTVRTVDRFIANNKIPYFRIPTGGGGATRIRFELRSIDQWLNQHRHGPDEHYNAQTHGEACQSVVDATRARQAALAVMRRKGV